MPTIISHSLIGVFAAAGLYRKKKYLPVLLILAVICSIIPDADVIGFYFGVPYGSLFGHRGFFHSLTFAFMFSVLLTSFFMFKRDLSAADNAIIFMIFLLSICSHGFFDALTSGGLGVAFFSPFDQTRYFFAERPVLVSPIGIKGFFNSYGFKVLMSELRYAVLPSFFVFAAIGVGRLLYKAGKRVN